MGETIGFIGLGNMGSGMAHNLIKGGYSLRVYNRSNDKAQTFARDTNAVVCATPAEASQGVQMAISMLADDTAVEEVMTGANGILAGLAPGGIHISCSTISPSASRRFASLHAERGSRYIGAPVFGRPAASKAAKLHILVSGSDAGTRAQVQPVLKMMGQSIWEFGDDAGAACVAKLCGNFLILAATEAMAEAFALAEKSGLDRRAVNDMLNGTLFTSPAYQMYGGMVAAEKYEWAGFSLPLALKDVRLLEDAGRQNQTPLPMADIVDQKMVAALAKGRGDYDAAVFALEASEAAGLRRTR